MTRSSTPLQESLSVLPPSFTYAEARARGLSGRTIYQLRDAHLIESLSYGLYGRVDTPQHERELVVAVTRAPLATICLVSALARHDLTDVIPGRIDLAIPRGARLPALEIPISWHTFEPKTFEAGRELLDLGDGIAIGLYNAERSIVDAFRLRRFEGPELGLEALRRWLRRGGSQPSSLLRMASLFPRTEAPIRRALEVLG